MPRAFIRGWVDAPIPPRTPKQIPPRCLDSRSLCGFGLRENRNQRATEIALPGRGNAPSLGSDTCAREGMASRAPLLAFLVGRFSIRGL